MSTAGTCARSSTASGSIQIDSVNVLVRSQELPLFARLGPHPRTMLADALDDGELFEYWAHMAAITPSSQHRLFRWRMNRAHQWDSVDRFKHRRPGFVDEVLAQVRDLGPITASDLGERVGKKSSWWDWDDGKIALEHLFHHGQVAARRRRNDFARLYDLPERVLPAAALNTTTPTEDKARKELLVIAARALGVATHGDLADYHRQNTTQCKPLVRELVEAGELLPATVEGWDKPAYVHPEATVPRWVKGRALLSPFDSLVWNRERTERAVRLRLPHRDLHTAAQARLRLLRACRSCSTASSSGASTSRPIAPPATLRVQAAHAEPGVDDAPVAVNLAAELRSMADWLELDAGGARPTAATSPRRCARPACHASTPPDGDDRWVRSAW